MTLVGFLKAAIFLENIVLKVTVIKAQGALDFSTAFTTTIAFTQKIWCSMKPWHLLIYYESTLLDLKVFV